MGAGCVRPERVTSQPGTLAEPRARAATVRASVASRDGGCRREACRVRVPPATSQPQVQPLPLIRSLHESLRRRHRYQASVQTSMEVVGGQLRAETSTVLAMLERLQGYTRAVLDVHGLLTGTVMAQLVNAVAVVTCIAAAHVTVATWAELLLAADLERVKAVLFYVAATCLAWLFTSLKRTSRSRLAVLTGGTHVQLLEAPLDGKAQTGPVAAALVCRRCASHLVRRSVRVDALGQGVGPSV